MRDSLRARLLLWYALILTTLIVLYGGTVSYRYRQSLLRDVDIDLATVAAVVGASVEADVSGELDLNLPPELREARFADGTLRFYYAVWNANGDLVDRSLGPCKQAIHDAAVSPQHRASDRGVDALGQLLA